MKVLKRVDRYSLVFLARSNGLLLIYDRSEPLGWPAEWPGDLGCRYYGEGIMRAEKRAWKGEQKRKR